jgi:radical SAM protein with 4Fe4S-binding SPASM domain
MKVFRRQYSLKELLIFKKSLVKLLLNPKKIINFIMVQVSRVFKLKKCLGLPFNVLIEPIAECNYQCIKCEKFSDVYRNDGPKGGIKAMNILLYRKIIDEIGDTLISLRLWNQGEPLMNGVIFEMIKYAKKKDVVVAVSSNLALLTQDKAKSIVQSGLDYLIVSFDGATRQSYKFHHGIDCFKRVLDNIRMIVDFKKKTNSFLPLIELQFIVMKENEKDINKMAEIAKELHLDKLTFLRLDTTYINFNKFKNISSKKDLLPDNRNYRLDMGKINALKRCRIAWEETLIRYSGLVLPCATDLGQKHKLGRVSENGKYLGFKKLWNNHNYQKFRQEAGSKADICHNCAKRDNNIKDQIIFNK